jgi:hypothetical protein
LRGCATAFSLLHGGSIGAVFFGEIAEQGVHGFRACRIDHRSPGAAHRDEMRMPQPIEVEGQGIGRDVEDRRDASCRNPRGPRAGEQPEDIKTVVLRERGQPVTACFVSIIPEI